MRSLNYSCFIYLAGFLDKNRDTFSADLVDLVAESKSKFLLELFSKERAMVCIFSGFSSTFC